MEVHGSLEYTGLWLRMCMSDFSGCVYLIHLIELGFELIMIGGWINFNCKFFFYLNLIVDHDTF